MKTQNYPLLETVSTEAPTLCNISAQHYTISPNPYAFLHLSLYFNSRLLKSRSLAKILPGRRRIAVNTCIFLHCAFKGVCIATHFLLSPKGPEKRDQQSKTLPRAVWTTRYAIPQLSHSNTMSVTLIGLSQSFEHDHYIPLVGHFEVILHFGHCRLNKLHFVRCAGVGVHPPTTLVALLPVSFISLATSACSSS